MAASKENIRENLVIQTAFLGDLLLAIPLIRQVRALDPESRLVLLARRPFGALIRELNLCDEVIEVNKRDSKEWARVSRDLKSRRFHWVISPHQSFRTQWLVANLDAETRVGFDWGWNFWVFDRRVRRPMQLPDALRQLSLLAAISEPFAMEFEKIQKDESYQNGVRIPPWAEMKVDLPAALRKSDAVTRGAVFFAPGSQWATKRWTPEGFRAVAEDSARRGHEIVFVGGDEDRELCTSIIGDSKWANLAGRTSLIELAALFSKGKILISNDSGLMHLAAVAGLPVVSIFGPTTLDLGYRPWQTAAVVVERELSCRPCGKHGHQSCPIGTHECMKGILGTDVIARMPTL